MYLERVGTRGATAAAVMFVYALSTRLCMRVGVCLSGRHACR